MKNLLILLIVLCSVLSGCRKGEDDPFLSIKTRTNRLCGKWKTVEYTKNVYSGSDENNCIMYEIILQNSEVKIFYNNAVVDSYMLTEEWEFTKEGKYKIDINAQPFSENEEGTWAWNGKDKNSKLKKKEIVYLTTNNIIYNNGETQDEYSGKTLFPLYSIAIKRLTDKEMVVVYDYTEQSSESGYYRMKSEQKLVKE